MTAVAASETGPELRLTPQVRSVLGPVIAALRLGAKLVSNHKNPNSRRLADAPGKSVDRHIAVFRKPPSD